MVKVVVGPLMARGVAAVASGLGHFNFIIHPSTGGLRVGGRIRTLCGIAMISIGAIGCTNGGGDHCAGTNVVGKHAGTFGGTVIALGRKSAVSFCDGVWWG